MIQCLHGFLLSLHTLVHVFLFLYFILIKQDNSIDSDSVSDKGKLPEDDGDNKYASLIKEKEVLLEQKETEIKEIKVLISMCNV